MFCWKWVVKIKKSKFIPFIRRRHEIVRIQGPAADSMLFLQFHFHWEFYFDVFAPECIVISYLSSARIYGKLHIKLTSAALRNEASHCEISMWNINNQLWESKFCQLCSIHNRASFIRTFADVSNFWILNQRNIVLAKNTNKSVFYFQLNIFYFAIKRKNKPFQKRNSVFSDEIVTRKLL